jgi:DNA polymerase III subunit beta
MPTPEMQDAVQLNVADFKEMIHQVAFAASTDEARPVLMGVLMNVEKDKVTMAAADGFRLVGAQGAVIEQREKPDQYHHPFAGIE